MVIDGQLAEAVSEHCEPESVVEIDDWKSP
jgi:hypothetical protein